MKLLKHITLLFIFLFSNLFSQSDFRNDVLLIKLREGTELNIIEKTDAIGQKEISTGITSLDQIVAESKCESIKNLFVGSKDNTLKRWYIFKFKDSLDIEKKLNRYSRLSNYFDNVEKYPIPQVSFTPNDPLFNSQDSKCAYDINLPQAWDVEQGNSNVIVGIIDNGLDWFHPDIDINNIYQNISGGVGGYGEDVDGDGHTLEIINGQIQLDPGDLNGSDDDGNGKNDDLAGWDFLSDDNTVLATDYQSQHGLSMFGLIAANSNNSIGSAGVAFNSRILHCKAGSGGFIQGNWISAIYYLADMGVDIISMSFFGGYNSAAEDAINYAYNTKGCILVACSGFTSGAPANSYKYPASYDNIISASILENDATLMRLNSYVNDKVDVLTSRTYTYPGIDINGNPTYSNSMHSSGATAVTAGLAALLKSHYPSWTNEMIVNQILLTCSSRDDQNRAGSNQYGFDFYGLIGNGLDNAYKALVFNGTIAENFIWSKNLKIFHNITLSAGKTLTLRPSTNLEFQSNKTFKAYGNLVIQGDLTINQDINIMQGGTLSISPGATLKFASGKSLIVHGVLNAQGTSSQPITFTAESGASSSSWGTIKLNGSGASGSIIKYANISYATQVEAVNVPDFEISNCNFTDNYKAVYVYNSTGTISNNNITSSSIGHVIDVRNASTVDCNANIITKSNRRGFAILYGGGSDGYATENDIYGCDVGIGIIWSSFSSSHSPTYLAKNNRIRNCNDGFKVYRLSSGSFGIPPNDDDARNSIYGNTRNVSVAKSYPSYTASLEAPWNWWGSYPPNQSLFSVGLYGNFVFSPPLSNDPWYGIPKAAPKNIAASTELNKSITADPGSIYYGIELRFQKKYKQAKNFFISYIAEHPNHQRAYVELYNCYSEETADDLINFFTKLPSEASKDHRLLLSYLYLKESRTGSGAERQKNIESAEKINNSIIEENPNTSLSVRAKINNIYIALFNEDNLGKASSIFTEIVDKTQLSTKMELADVKDAIDIYAGTFKSGGNNSDSPIFKKDDSALETPKEYSLLGNYPNPFNPSTIISYNLPFVSEVEVTIYDILGNEVKTFIISSQNSGTQKIMWNGRNSNGEQVSSGIYLYHFKAVSLEKNNQVFEKSAKLILLR